MCVFGDIVIAISIYFFMKILKASCSVFVVIFIISFMFSRFVLVVVNDSNSINKGIVVVLDCLSYHQQE